MNPIDHRLFSEISKNWAGHPLRCYRTILNHIRTTTTDTGLRVTAQLVDHEYPNGVKFSDAQFALPSHLNLTRSNPKFQRPILVSICYNRVYLVCSCKSCPCK